MTNNRGFGILALTGGIAALLYAAFSLADGRKKEAVNAEVASYVANTDMAGLIERAVNAAVQKTADRKIGDAVAYSIADIRRDIDSRVGNGINSVFSKVERTAAEKVLARADGYSKELIDQNVLSRARQIASDKFRNDLKEIRSEYEDKYDDEIEDLVDDLKDKYKDRLDEVIDKMEDRSTLADILVQALKKD